MPNEPENNFDDVMPGLEDLMPGVEDLDSELLGRVERDEDELLHAVVDAAHEPPGRAVGELRPGALVADVVLVEQLASGGGMVCWKARRQDDGAEQTVHALEDSASDAERDHFLSAASDLAGLLAGEPLDGVLPIASIDPLAGAYVGELAPLGTMVDVPLLNWKVSRKIDFLRRIAVTLRALHERDLVHGCLRPETVVLDEDLHPVLANTGGVDIAAACKRDPFASSKHRAYAAPSVLDGEEADRYADMYSLGRLLQFMLLGEDPVEYGEPIPRLESLKTAPPGLVRIVRRCTVLDAAQRYPNMRELLDDLDRFERDEPVGMAHPELDDAARYASGTRKAGRKRAEAARPVAAPAAPRPSRDGPGILARPAVRLPVIAVPGSALIAAGSMLAFRSGKEHVAFLAMALVGALIVGFAPPAFGRNKALSRVLFVVAALAAVFVGNVTGRAAEIGAEHTDLRAGSLDERLEAFRQLKREGQQDFSSLDLSGADLSGTDLQKLVFDSANFKGTVFRGANLAGASLLNAELSQANFAGADLTGINVHFTRNFADSICDSTTVMPAGWTCDNGKPVSARAAK